MYAGLQDLRFEPMSKPKVVIIDYGVGNLLSVQRAVEECGAEAIMSSTPGFIAQADRVILPGVGSFANAMLALKSLGLVEPIKEIAANGIPLLGICLGMQLLLDESEEHGLTKGLGIIPGRVGPLSNLSSDGSPIKIPHIGWSSLIASENATWDNTILQNLSPGNAVYFLHSFMAIPKNPKMRIADCVYGLNRISAVISRDNITGCQFHPEKSGVIGIEIIKNFLLHSHLPN